MNEYTNLFLRQSYLDSYSEYEKSLQKDSYPVWDYVLLTASNKSQASTYMAQITHRLSEQHLPSRTHYAVLPDPDDKRVGSGGATLHALQYIKEHLHHRPFGDLKILIIHSGGDSKRIPQYSACGKLFSPVPRELPDGRRSTLFDEFIIGLTGVPARMPGGMLIASGDVLLLFNPLQIDFYNKGAAAFSIKESAITGKDHGVYLRDEDGNVSRFLHKQPIHRLRELGAIDARDNVDIDTGAVFMDSYMMEDLYSLISTPQGYATYVNDQVRLSFYADFLYPLATNSTLEEYYQENPEGAFSDALTACRTTLWNLLHKYTMKLLRFSPASFIHFGTTRELLDLLNQKIASYQFLDWSSCIGSNTTQDNYAISNSYVAKNVTIGEGSYIEDSYLCEGTIIGKGCVISGMTLEDIIIPDHTVMHGLKQKDGSFVARMYGIDDNPKNNSLFDQEIPMPLWEMKLFPMCDSPENAARATLLHIQEGKPYDQLCSLQESYQHADTESILPWQVKLSDIIRAEILLDCIDQREYVDTVAALYPRGISARTTRILLAEADRLDYRIERDFSRKIRIYYYLYKLSVNHEKDMYHDFCFRTITDAILDRAASGTSYHPEYRIQKEEVITYLPVRVNWGGGWSDTPPYCNEHGGTVLNAAITLNGQMPVEVILRQTEELSIVLASADNGSYKVFVDTKELQDCRNPFDPFSLHKAALIACGIIPLQEDIPLKTILERLGGGIYLSTQVINIPRGSGLGTSSILAGACAKGIYDFLGIQATENELYAKVLCMEQIMSTGGGWQDQVGGLCPGIKLICSTPGLEQTIKCNSLTLSDKTKAELQERFCLVYTGQRRLARNLLREVVGKYIASNPDALYVLTEIQSIAFKMANALENDNVTLFAELLSQHWKLSKLLDQGCTNTCIDQIFITCDNLIDGKMICGAGGGGFIQVILKKGVTKPMLKQRLDTVFADSGVEVWECQFI